MARTDQLTPPEQFLLLDPQNASPSELIKIGLLALAASGIVRVTEGPTKGFLKRQATSLFNLVPGRSLDAPGSLAPLVEIVQRAGGGSTEVVAKEARRAFGDKLLGYRQKLQEGLERRGFLSKSTKPVMFVFTRQTYEPTAAGMMARAQIRKAIESTWRLPNLIYSNPAEAAALMVIAGSSLLIVPELREHYQRMGEIARKHNSDGGDSGDVGSWSSSSDSALGTFDSSAFANFDTTSFSALDSSMGSFDSSFDSSFGGDGGGDSGGGDGGGGGGD